MSSFETVVRPVVLPNIRPGSSRVAAKGSSSGAAFGGAGARVIDLVHSRHDSVQRQLPHVEQERTFDKDRIYQKDDDGNINKDNFVDVERMTMLRAIGGSPGPVGAKAAGEKLEIKFAAPPTVDNVETLESDQVRIAGDGGE